MKKPAKDPVREDRIHNEAIADANGPEEQIMGWHCYLDEKIRFPFQARCIARRIVSPLRETVEVHRMAPEDACSTDMLVLIRWHGRVMAVPLSQLTPIDPDEATTEAIADWHLPGGERLPFSESPVGFTSVMHARRKLTREAVRKLEAAVLRKPQPKEQPTEAIVA